MQIVLLTSVEKSSSTPRRSNRESEKGRDCRESTRGRQGVPVVPSLSSRRRGFYYEGWDPSHKPLPEHHKKQFLARIEQEFQGDECIDPEQLARSVLTMLATRAFSPRERSPSTSDFRPDPAIRTRRHGGGKRPASGRWSGLPPRR